MPTYAYTAYDSAGAKVEGLIEATDSAAAAERLHQKGLIAFRTVEAKAGHRSSRTWFAGSKRREPSLSELADFARQLATLLRAELPLDQCLRLVASQSDATMTGAFAGRLADAVVAGRALSTTFEQQAPNAPTFIAPLLRASEARGSLTPGLVDLARILERRVEARDRVRSALVYPALLLVVALLTVTLVIGVLVPTLMPLFKDAGAAPPTGLWAANEVREFLLTQWPVALAGAGLVIAGGIWLARRPRVRQAGGRLLLRLPLVGSITRQTNVAMMARTLGTLLRNGVPLVSALSLSATVVSSPQFRDSILQSAEAVKEGSRLATALRQSQVYPDVALRFITIGEEASKLDEMLLHLADLADSQSQRSIDGLLTMLSPAITLLVGMVIGGLILSVMQAVLSVNDIALQ
jgi:general secretion pathway protein F